MPLRRQNLRECIHSPWPPNHLWQHETSDLQSLKQVPCQSVGPAPELLKTTYKTIPWSETVVVYRNGDMSSRCRHNRTGIMTTGAKLLIVRGCATVAEGRQAQRCLSGQAGRYRRAEVKADSRRGSGACRHRAQNSRPEPKAFDSRVKLKPGDEAHLTLRTVALFRHYIGRRASPILR